MFGNTVYIVSFNRLRVSALKIWYHYQTYSCQFTSNPVKKLLKISQSRTARALRNLVNSYQVIQVGSRFRDDFRSIGAEKSRHVGAKSQRFLDFNFSKAFLVSFLKLFSSHLSLGNFKIISQQETFKA